METITLGFIPDKGKLYNRARALALITIIYNVAEGVVSVFFGLEDNTIALFGFGLDSFVEVISGIGILHMVTRLPGWMNGISYIQEKENLLCMIWITIPRNHLTWILS